MAGPLSGLRIVDCSSGTAGPRATGLFADYGADVVWVEPPGGDRFRDQLSVPYSVFNRGKGSVEIDLASDAGRALVYDLIASADVFVQSWRPGVAERLGVGYEDLHRAHPQVVYCSISGFGVDGPSASLPGYESIVHALVGTMGEQPGHRPPPIFEGLPFASIGAAYLAAIGIVAALYRRFDDGIGRHIETSLMDGALAYLTMLWGDADVPPPPRDPGSNRLIARNYECADGEVIGVHTGAVGAFGRLMTLLGLHDRVPPSEHGLDMAIRLTPEQRSLLDRALPDAFATQDREAWEKQLTAADVCAVPILQPGGVLDATQARHNHMVLQIDDPIHGLIDQVAPAIRFAATPHDVHIGAPRVGERSPSWADASERPQPGTQSEAPVDDRPLLEGLRVLDLGAYYAGPYGSRLLADLGADVVRVETMLGDPNRGSEVIFRSSHAGMRSVALDLKHPDSRLVADRLLGWADVVHHSMRPGAAERLAVDHVRARALNPSVVYAYAPGWGSTGPMCDRQSFAPMMSGYVGVAYEVAGQFNAPVYPSGNEDPGNGLLGAFAMLAAIVHRRTTGVAQYLEHPQLNAAMAHMSHIVRTEDGEVLGALRLDPLQFGVDPLDRLYETSDSWVCVVATSDREFHALAKVLGGGLCDDPAFATAADRRSNADRLSARLEAEIAPRVAAELVGALAAVGVAAAVPVAYNCAGFLRDPENIRTGRSAECPHETRGRVREVGTLIRSSHAKAATHRLAPALGADNDAMLAEIGFSTDQIAQLRLARAIV